MQPTREDTHYRCALVGALQHQANVLVNIVAYWTSYNRGDFCLFLFLLFLLLLLLLLLSGSSCQRATTPCFCWGQQIGEKGQNSVKSLLANTEGGVERTNKFPPKPRHPLNAVRTGHGAVNHPSVHRGKRTALLLSKTQNGHHKVWGVSYRHQNCSATASSSSCIL